MAAGLDSTCNSTLSGTWFVSMAVSAAARVVDVGTVPNAPLVLLVLLLATVVVVVDVVLVVLVVVVVVSLSPPPPPHAVESSMTAARSAHAVVRRVPLL
ncbi:MAG: hypothetical protein M3394_09050 [Actinomycetota bacterium]|nr:hypothetical protein [Actinomycetota bacterium]